MNKVVLDTNALISALFGKGASRAVLKLAEQGAFQIFITREILSEFGNVVKRDFHFSDFEIWQVLQTVLTISTIVETDIKLGIVKKDPTDNKILECACACDAEYILSYDHHLLEIGKFGKISIIKPEVFLKLIRQTGQ